MGETFNITTEYYQTHDSMPEDFPEHNSLLYHFRPQFLNVPVNFLASRLKHLKPFHRFRKCLDADGPQ